MRSGWHNHPVRLAIRICSAILLIGSCNHFLIAQYTASGAINQDNIADHSTPLLFIENEGQFAQNVQFQVLTNSMTMHISHNTLWIALFEKPVSSTEPTRGLQMLESSHQSMKQQSRRGVAIKISFVDANPDSQLVPFNQLNTVVSYLRAPNQAASQSAVHVWGGVRYTDLYPSIDLEITGASGHLLPRLVTRPGANLRDVRLHIEGAKELGVESSYLRLATDVGDWELPLLMVEQGSLPMTIDRTGIQSFLVIAPLISASARYSVVTAPLEASDLRYATFLDGSNSAQRQGIAVDQEGAAYIIGTTTRLDFPTTPGAFDTSLNGTTDIFVVKLHPDGSTLDYATFLGAVEGDYFATSAIAVDQEGRAYITGSTDDANFPTTPGAFDTSYAGGTTDIFVVKLRPDGSALDYATFLGGSNSERAAGIAIDQSGAAYVTGITQSPDFPTTPGAYDTSHKDGFDMYVAKLSPDGSTLVYATFSVGYAGIAVDQQGAAYVTGSTDSVVFPATPGAFDTTFNGGYDAYVMKLAPDGSALDYATFLGGTPEDDLWPEDRGADIAVDAAGAAYVVGTTYSIDFPTTVGAFDTVLSGRIDVFVVKLHPDGSALNYATLLGGRGGDIGLDIAVDQAGSAYITGWTTSDDFPTTLRAFDTDASIYGGAYVVKLRPDGGDLEYATILGGGGCDSDDFADGNGIAVNEEDVAYVIGYTNKRDFPTTPGAFDTTLDFEGTFVAKIAMTVVAVKGVVYLPSLMNEQIRQQTDEEFTSECEDKGIRLFDNPTAELDSRYVAIRHD